MSFSSLLCLVYYYFSFCAEDDEYIMRYCDKYGGKKKVYTILVLRISRILSNSMNLILGFENILIEIFLQNIKYGKSHSRVY